jgi:hypothetical protein
MHEEDDEVMESPVTLWNILDKTWLKARSNVDEYWTRKINVYHQKSASLQEQLKVWGL